LPRRSAFCISSLFFLSPFNIEFIFGVGVGLLVRRGWHHFSRTLASTGIVLFVLGLIFVDYRIVGGLCCAIGVRGKHGNCGPWAGHSAVAPLRWGWQRLLAFSWNFLFAYLVHPGVEMGHLCAAEIWRRATIALGF